MQLQTLASLELEGKVSELNEDLRVQTLCVVELDNEIKNWDLDVPDIEHRKPTDLEEMMRGLARQSAVH